MSECNKKGKNGCSYQTGWSINGHWYCSNHWSVVPRLVVGTVFANNVKDLENLDSIRNCFIMGTGLLGDVLEAGLELAEFENRAGYLGDHMTEELSEALKQQRVKFYQTLKVIERTIQNNEF